MTHKEIIDSLTESTISVHNELGLAVSLEDKLVEWNNMTSEELVAELELVNSMIDATHRMSNQNDFLEE